MRSIEEELFIFISDTFNYNGTIGEKGKRITMVQKKGEREKRITMVQKKGKGGKNYNEK